MRFSIVTPSYKQPEWLRLCAASVADQAGPGVEIEHIVQDSLSGLEIAEVLAPFPQVKLISEKDSGMYDAIIRGWEKATGDVLCWLNCDEQYLPGALKEVAGYFRDHPDVDVLFADIVVVDAGGGYMCSRQVLKPHLYHTWTCHLQPFSCATFFRSSLLKKRGLSLDPKWKDLGDAEWIVRLLRARVRMGVMRRYISTFVDDGNNRNLKPLARQERAILTSQAPRWVQALRLAWMLLHRMRRLWHGLYWPKPFAYDIFTQSSPLQRIHFDVPRPTFFWKARMKWSAKAVPAKGTAPISHQPQRLLFVVGFFRSGTSLLYSFLNLHPDIKLLFEADLQCNLLVDISAATGRRWWERLDFYNTCIRRHGLTAQPLWRQAGIAKQAAEILYRQYGGSETLYVGEKSPNYYNHLRPLARRYPDARFIVVWRHPRDVMASIQAAGQTHYFFRNSSLPLRSVIGLEQLQADTLALRAAGTHIFDLCYEDLIENPETMLKSICKFLEVPFNSRMLDLDKADCKMFPPGEHHRKARSGHITTGSRPEPTGLGPIESKIARYLSRWAVRFQDRLATRRYWEKPEGKVLGPGEVLRDRLSYAWARIYFERFTPVIYGIFPLAWLRTYRRWRGSSSVPTSSGDFGLARGNRLKISVITPHYKQLPWLRLCAASVADQQGVEVEHIVQDAQSGHDIEEWARQHPEIQLHVECDSGMYDAINRGFARATGDIVCWLNSDEQYLPGTLAKVAAYFTAHPEIDVLFGDALLIGNTGDLLSYRRTIMPNLHHIQLAHLNALSCATFMHRSVLDRGHRLDTRWKTIADAVWIADLLKAGTPMAVLNEPLSVFTITDNNIGQTSLALTENNRWQEEVMSGRLGLRPVYVAWHRLKKLIEGAYWPRSVSASIYTLTSPKERVTREAAFLGFQWPRPTSSLLP